MCIDLSGQWKVDFITDSGRECGVVSLPGTLQGQGFGNSISEKTPWISTLHDSFWYEQEEYKQAQQEECLIPFLAQPPKHFMGEAFYEREFVIEENNETDLEWFLRIEVTHWKTLVWIDDKYMGEDSSLCTAHEIPCGKLTAGRHVLKVCVDNSMQYPYRPDAHSVSDALGATWNGMAGEILLLSAVERQNRQAEKRAYMMAHPRTAQVKDGRFYIDGHPEYFRGTHFGGDYPLTGYPETEKSWWIDKFRIIKDWGLNAVRFHSYCPPEAAFTAADEEDVYLLVECGMWNVFNDKIEMLKALERETQRILQEFGHHPSFVFFSPSNEPSGYWYNVLREWVAKTKAYDEQLGYQGRRLYTAESGWFYEVSPSEISGVDFVYFHRSAYGPYEGGVIRKHLGWKGRDYSPSLQGIKLPVLSHELGQWCAYPDFEVINKFTGYLKPGNYMVFRELAKKRGLLSKNKEMVNASGKNQLRLYKEELEASFRTPEINGFELLDLHDYLGQGTALVGFLDPLWENKGYTKPAEFREFCNETVLLIRSSSYVWKNTQTAVLPIEICHYGKTDLEDAVILWSLDELRGGKNYIQGKIKAPKILKGRNTALGAISLDFSKIIENSEMVLTLSMDFSMGNEGGEGQSVKNQWHFHVFIFPQDSVNDVKNVVYTGDWQEALFNLKEGENVVFSPHLSDLNYECPALSLKNVFWNSQMGPTWGRNLGVVIQKDHPLFEMFPTEAAGGWQWEDILNHARGFDLRGLEGIEPIVRPIDDWNRSLPLGLLLEAKVEQGNLLIISADLEGSFEERPEAYHLKNAICQYASSERFKPKAVLTAKQIEERLFPVLRMQELVEEYHFDKEAMVKNAGELFGANPNRSVKIEKKEFPVTIELTLKEPVAAKGWLYLPEQRDRAHEGFLREYALEYLDMNGWWKEAARGSFLNTSLSQQINFPQEIYAKKWRLIVYSCYGCVDKTVWQEEQDGWYQVFMPQRAVLQIAGFHVLCEKDAEHSNSIFWGGEQKSATKEIDN